METNPCSIFIIHQTEKNNHFRTPRPNSLSLRLFFCLLIYYQDPKRLDCSKRCYIPEIEETLSDYQVQTVRKPRVVSKYIYYSQTGSTETFFGD